jgi:8-oxo-dGTP pyrophosphatase MutT (NUDIX family)
MKLTDALANVLDRLDRRGASRGGEVAVPVQAGALPWRFKDRKAPEVMLVTGRRSGRWMIPKGWPMPGESLADSAAQEAFEEAGIKGRIDARPLGSFRHVKRHLLFGNLEVDILVHPLAVERELGEWPERGERTRRWFSIKDAAARVDSRDLRKLIIRFGKSLTPGKR